MSKLLVMLSLLALVGCKDKPVEPEVATQTTGGEETKPVKQTVTLYSGRSEALVSPVIAKFEEETGIDVEVKYGSTGELAGTLLEEGERSSADVFWAQDAQTLGVLTEKGLLAPMPESVLAKSESPYQAPNKDWVATSGRARVLVYNTEKVKAEDLPKTVEELTDAKWKGRVGWAPENASFQAFVAAMIELKGAEETQKWLEGMVANEPKAYPKNTPAVLATGKGEVDVALVNHYYLYRVKAEQGQEFPAENYYFKNGAAESLINVSGMAMLKTAKNTESAQKLVEYLLDKTAQEHFANETYEFPTAAGVEASAKLPGMNTLNAPALDVAKLSNLEKTVELLKATKALP